MIRHESVITALIGAVIGILLGLGLASLLAARLDEVSFAVPTGQLVDLRRRLGRRRDLRRHLAGPPSRPPEPLGGTAVRVDTEWFSATVGRGATARGHHSASFRLPSRGPGYPAAGDHRHRPCPIRKEHPSCAASPARCFHLPSWPACSARRSSPYRPEPAGAVSSTSRPTVAVSGSPWRARSRRSRTASRSASARSNSTSRSPRTATRSSPTTARSSGTKCKDTAPYTPGDPEYPYVGKFIKTLTLKQVKQLDCGSLTQPAHPRPDA